MPKQAVNQWAPMPTRSTSQAVGDAFMKGVTSVAPAVQAVASAVHRRWPHLMEAQRHQPFDHEAARRGVKEEQLRRHPPKKALSTTGRPKHPSHLSGVRVGEASSPGPPKRTAKAGIRKHKARKGTTRPARPAARMRTVQMDSNLLSAPAREMVVTKSSWHKHNYGAAQKNTEQGPMTGNNSRLEFSDLSPYLVAWDGTTSKAFLFAGTWYSAIDLSAAVFSTRIQNQVKNYQWMAIRELYVQYEGAQGTSTAGMICLGYLTNTDTNASNTTALTGASVMENKPAVSGPVWGTFGLQTAFTGTKLFSTSLNSQSTTSNNSVFQGAITGAFQVNPATSNITQGVMRLTGVIDLYGESPPVQNPGNYLEGSDRSLVMRHLTPDDVRKVAVYMVNLALEREAAALRAEAKVDNWVSVPDDGKSESPPDVLVVKAPLPDVARALSAASTSYKSPLVTAGGAVARPQSATRA